MTHVTLRPEFETLIDPYAPVEVASFTPVLFGTQKIAEITTSAYPQGGAWLILVFTLGVSILALWHVVRGLRGSASGG